MADEPAKEKPGLGERLFDVVTAAQVAHAVIGAPAMPVKQPQLAPPTTPPAISRSVEREAPASAPLVSSEVGQAADNIEHVNRERRSAAMEHGQAEARPQAAQYAPKPPPARDPKRQRDRSRSRDR